MPLISPYNKARIVDFYHKIFFNIIGVFLGMFGISLLCYYVAFLLDIPITFLTCLKHCSMCFGIIFSLIGGFFLACD